MEHLLEYGEWKEINEGLNEFIEKTKKNLFNFIKNHKRGILTVTSSLVTMYILYKYYQSMNERYITRNGEFADEETKNFIYTAYSNKYSDRAVELMKSFQQDLVADYKKTGVKLNDYEINERFEKYMKKNLKDIDIKLNLYGIGILDRDSGVFFSNQKKIYIGVFGGISNIFYNDKKFNKRISTLSNVITHEMTHYQQYIDKKNIHTKEFIGSEPKDHIKYLLQPIEIEAYINEIVNELQRQNISSYEFKKIFDSGKKVPANGMFIYDNIFSRKSKFMILMRDLIISELKKEENKN